MDYFCGDDELKMKGQTKNITFKVIGYGIIIASFSYIFFLLRNFEYSKFQDSLKDFFLIKFCIFTFICAFSNFILAFAWRYILELLHQKYLPFQTISKIYLKTFIARYIPGNIFHFAGRQLLGSQLSISQTNLAISSVLETFLLVIVGFTFLLIGFFNNYLDFSIFNHLAINSKKLIFLFASGCFLVVLYFIYNKSLNEVFRAFSIKRVSYLVKLWIFYTLFLLISGVILFCVFSLMIESDIRIISLPVVICANVFAWIGGVITPGAPGGLGVREALLMILLSDILSITVIVAGVVLFRVITLFGEILALCIVIFFFQISVEKNLPST